MPALHHHMRSFTVQGIARSMQTFKARQRVLDLQQRPVPVVTGSLVQHERRNIQINDPTGIVQTLPIFRIKHDTATCRHDNVAHRRQLCDGLHFTTPKSILSFDFKNRRNRHPGPLHDFVIGVMKISPETPGQLPPDGRLASPHEADQIDVCMSIHGAILADYSQGTKKGPALPALFICQTALNRDAIFRK